MPPSIVVIITPLHLDPFLSHISRSGFCNLDAGLAIDVAIPTGHTHRARQSEISALTTRPASASVGHLCTGTPSPLRVENLPDAMIDPCQMQPSFAVARLGLHRANALS
jgi:hypothetical protein